MRQTFFDYDISLAILREETLRRRALRKIRIRKGTNCSEKGELQNTGVFGGASQNKSSKGGLSIFGAPHDFRM
jgi:hypothetical protein